MLTYFPTPYPDEWWYSVLCRYYVRSGKREHLLVKEELFGGNGGAHMGTLFPNGTIVQVLNKLPPGVLDCREVVLKYTLFPYYTRMYPMDQKEEMLRKICMGDTVQLTHLWRSTHKSSWGPRYCPCCTREDKKRYGEPYWHVDHQIPLMQVCPKHHCRLEQLEMPSPYPTLNQKFFPLSDVMLKEPSWGIQEWEQTVSKRVREYQMLPLSVGPTEHNNLAQILMNQGFRAINRQGSVSLNYQTLYAALVEHYGKDQIQEIFGCGLNGNMVQRIMRWEQLLPDRYILLQVIAGITTETVFSSTPVRDQLLDRLMKMKRKQIFCSIGQVAEGLGLHDFEVKILTRYYHMEPFWIQQKKLKADKPRTALIRCNVSKEEYDRIQRYAQAMGYRCIGPFVMECVRYAIERMKEK